MSHADVPDDETRLHTYTSRPLQHPLSCTPPYAEGAVLVTCRDAYLAADADSEWLGFFKWNSLCIQQPEYNWLPSSARDDIKNTPLYPAHLSRSFSYVRGGYPCELGACDSQALFIACHFHACFSCLHIYFRFYMFSTTYMAPVVLAVFFQTL